VVDLPLKQQEQLLKQTTHHSVANPVTVADTAVETAGLTVTKTAAKVVADTAVEIAGVTAITIAVRVVLPKPPTVVGVM